MLRSFSFYITFFLAGTSVIGAQDLYVEIHIDGIPYVCPGGTVTCTAFVPDQPDQETFRFAWSTGDTTAKVLLPEPGPYSVTVTDDKGNSGSSSFELLGGEFPQPAIDLTDTRFCAGDEDGLIQLLSARYEVIQLEFIPPLETLQHGDSLALHIELQLRGSACAGEMIIGGLHFYNEMPVPVIDGPAEVYAREPVIYSVAEKSPDHRYNWRIEGGSIDWTAHGQVQVTWSDTEYEHSLCVYSELIGHSCLSETTCIEPGLISSAKDISHGEVAIPLPNPASDRLILPGIPAGTSLLFADCRGYVVYKRDFHTDTDSVEVDCSSWPVGVYLYRVGQSSGSSACGVILVQR